MRRLPPLASPVVWAPALALAVLLIAGPDGHPAKKKKDKDLWTVQVREAQVRAQPSVLSPVVFRAAYTSRVRVVDTAGDWRQVEVPDRALSGWLLASALIEKQIVLQAPDKKTAKRLAEKKEESLAGRSFQPSVERKLKGKEKKDLETGWVRLDQAVAAVDASAPTPAELETFRTEGGLTPLPGAQLSQARLSEAGR